MGRYERFRDRRLDWDYVVDAEEAAERLERIRGFRPRAVAVDFETTRTHIRLVQLGFEVPGYRPQQLVFDCREVSSGLFAPLFADRRVCKIVHFSQFEQGWCASEIGTVMDNVLDTCIAWRCIQTECARLLNAGRRDEVERILPGYRPHPNTLTGLCRARFGFSLPKDEQSGDWGARRLREEQLVYAAMDVAVLPPLARDATAVLRGFGLVQKARSQTRGVGERARARHRAR